MAAYTGSNKAINLRHGLVTWVLPSGDEVALEPTDGDLTISEISADAREEVPVMNRGDVIALVEGNSEQATFSLTLRHAGVWTDGVFVTAKDAILRTGSLASTDTVDPGGVVYTGTIRATYIRPGLAPQRATLNNVRAKIGYGDASEGNTLSITGTAYGYTSGGVRVLPVTYEVV